MMNSVLQLLKSQRLPWLLFILTVYFGYQHVATLKDANYRLNANNSELIGVIDLKDRTLDALQEQNRSRQQALIEQKEAVQEAERLNRQYDQLLERLKDENQQLRSWFDAGLPDDIKRLLDRPEIKGSEDYRTWMSVRDAVLSAGRQAENTSVAD